MTWSGSRGRRSDQGWDPTLGHQAVAQTPGLRVGSTGRGGNGSTALSSLSEDPRGIASEQGELGSGRRVAQWVPWLGACPCLCQLLVAPGAGSAPRGLLSRPGGRCEDVRQLLSLCLASQGADGDCSVRGESQLHQHLPWGSQWSSRLKHSTGSRQPTAYELSAENLSAAGRGGSRGLTYAEPVHGEQSWVGAAPPEGPGVEAGQARSWSADQQRRTHSRAWCPHSGLTAAQAKL